MRFMSKEGSGRFSRPISLSEDLRTQLQQERIFADLDMDKRARRVGLCACHAGAGTTTVALNLAAMLAERTGTPTALVEANLRTPALAYQFGLRADPGLLAFAGGATGLEVFRDLPTMNVRAMLAQTSDKPMTVLRQAVGRMPILSETFQHVVLDLPPVLDYPDAGMMVAGIDGVLLVLEAEQTRWEVAHEVRKRLEAAGASILGAVLNKKPHHVPDWLYQHL